VRGHLDREQAARRERAEQGRLAAGAGAEVEPALVRSLQRRVDEGERAELAALVLDPGPAVPDRGQRARVTAGRKPDGIGRPRTGLAAGLLGQLVPVDPARPDDQVGLRPGVVGGQRLLGLGQVAAERECRWARAASGSAGAVSAIQPSQSSRATRRSTALTKPAARRGARSTVADTAACGGTRVRSSWYAPSRSAARAAESIWLTGRSAQRARNTSRVPAARRVP